MEADWELEIGGDSAVIEAYWSGFVDLRTHPERVSELSECGELPGLDDALIRLNAPDSSVWTSKTDVFIPEQIDVYEMEASVQDSRNALSCYVDLLQRSSHVWNPHADGRHYFENLCTELRVADLGCCRVDIVVRRALVGDMDDFGATVYFTACGRTVSDTKKRLAECMAVFADVMVGP